MRERVQRPAGVMAGRATPWILAVGSVLVLALLGALRPAPSVAACPSPPDVAAMAARGGVVFVGSVLYLENDNRWATVVIEEPWIGAPPAGDTVEVQGGGPPGTSTQADRSYEPGRYLFMVVHGSESLVDDACSGTRPWTDDLARLRPAGVEAAPGLAIDTPISTVAFDSVAPIAGLVLALLVAVVAYLIILRARRRPPEWRR